MTSPLRSGGLCPPSLLSGKLPHAHPYRHALCPGLDQCCVHRSEMKNQLDGVSVRVDRMERELEYLENKIPTQGDIEMEEALLEQQIKDAELDLLKTKAKIKMDRGKEASVSKL